MTKPLKRTAALPLGFEATFTWDDGAMSVSWEPEVPVIQSPRHWRRFLRAYQDARRDFLRDVATTLGGNVGVADLTGEIEVIQPATKH